MEYDTEIKDDTRVSDQSNWKMEHRTVNWWRLQRNGFVGSGYQQLWFGDVQLFNLLDIQVEMWNGQSDLPIWTPGKTSKMGIKFGNRHLHWWNLKPQDKRTLWEGMKEENQASIVSFLKAKWGKVYGGGGSGQLCQMLPTVQVKWLRTMTTELRTLAKLIRSTLVEW